MAQKYFNQGLNLLHCFWDFEAYRAFKEAIRHDTSCAMAYWGIFKSLKYNRDEMAEERQSALLKAVELSSAVSEREQYYIRAASYIMQWKANDYVREMKALIKRYPEDVEAKLLLANFLTTGHRPDGTPKKGQLEGLEIIRKLLVSHPDHLAVHHYWIHAIETGSQPELALPSVEKIATLAPSSGHIVHMPGHIYFLIGEYEKARNSFMASMRVDEEYMRANNIKPVDNWNYVHNLDYLIANCAEGGRFREGMRWAKLSQGIPANPSRLKSIGYGYIVYSAHIAPARLQMRYAFWADAASSVEKIIKNDASSSTLVEGYHQGLLAYLKGMDAAEKSRLDEADKQAKALLVTIKQLSKKKPSLGSDWYFTPALKILNVQYFELRGLMFSQGGNYPQAIGVLEKASRMEKDLGYWEPPHYSRPVLESLGEVYMNAKQWEQARRVYESVLQLRPNSGHALVGIAKSYELAGQKTEARKAYKKFLDVWKNADPELRRVREAKSWLAAANK